MPRAGEDINEWQIDPFFWNNYSPPLKNEKYIEPWYCNYWEEWVYDETKEHRDIRWLGPIDWEELPIGWSWLKLIWYGDFLNFLPIAILSGITIFCYIVILPNMLVRKDYWMAMIAFLEILILCLAASGILTVGH